MRDSLASDPLQRVVEFSAGARIAEPCKED